MLAFDNKALKEAKSSSGLWVWEPNPYIALIVLNTREFNLKR